MNRLLPHLVALATAGATQLVTAPAQADDAHDARVLYQKANAAFRAGDSILARDYYRKSLEKYESFDTLCNLGRAEAQDKLFSEAYRNLSMCVELYPEDEELAGARTKFVELKNEVRGRLASDESRGIDEAIVAEMKRREVEAGPQSGLEDEPVESDVEVAAAAEEPVVAGPPKNKWKLPVVISMAGVGVVGGVVGGVMLGRGGSKMREADDIQSSLGDSGCFDASSADCAQLDDLRQQSDSAKNLGVGLVAGGGAMLVGALAVYLLVPNEKGGSATRARGVASFRPQLGVQKDAWSFAINGQF